ncbi:MAG: hypothetical protein IJI10_01425 [Eubacterium sp.]|nr:hypothetical protein [Eubacterium sp.]
MSTEVRKNLTEKLENYYKSRGTAQERAEAHSEVIGTEKSINRKVADMVGKKLGRLDALSGRDIEPQKRKAAKYMDLGITEIVQAQRKAQNVLTVAQDELEAFVEAEKKSYIKSLNKTALSVLSDEEKEERADIHVKSYLLYGTVGTENVGYDEKKAKAKQKFDELRDEVARCRTEYNATLLAKQAFIEDNKDLIEEELRAKRLRDLRKSGILDELGIAEKKHEEKAEEGSEEGSEE